MRTIPSPKKQKNDRARLLPITLATTGLAVGGAAAALAVRRRNAKNGDSPEHELQTHLSDMATLNAFVLSEVDGHLGSQDLQGWDEERAFMEEIRRTLMMHNEGLERELERIGGRSRSKMKAAAGAFVGMASSMGERIIYRMQHYPVSRMLRDNYTMLSAVSVSQTMLHATARALHEERIVEMTDRHMRETAALIIKASRQIPRTVVAELATMHSDADQTVGAAAADATKEAWVNAEQPEGGV